METMIRRIDIIGLYGIKDYSIVLEDNKLIIVGENGTGKTTIFKIIYYALSCDWDELRTYEFEEICLWFNSSQVRITSKLLLSIYAIDDIDRIAIYTSRDIRGRRLLGASGDKILNILMANMRIAEGKTDQELEHEYLNNPYPYRYVKKLFQAEPIKKLYEYTKQIESSFDAKILYLPTYRRIEEQLINIFPNVDTDKLQMKRKNMVNERSIELIEFGMSDVEEAVDKFQYTLNIFSRTKQNILTLGYLSEIIREKYEQVEIEKIRKLSDAQIDDILKRIEQNILPYEHKQEIRGILRRIRNDEQTTLRVKDKIVCHYFLNLIQFDRDMRKEEKPLIDFIEMCNKYLVNNELSYDSQSISCTISNKTLDQNKHYIKFQNLSSGEKQIVSIFSHLYLSDNEKVFVFIDEPELSLSVDWQRMLLVDIIDSPCCIGVLATTHSPFVFDNKLEKYVHGVNEFCTRG